MMDCMETTGTSMHMPNVAMPSRGSYCMSLCIRRSCSTGSSDRCTALYVRLLMACTIAVSSLLHTAMLMNVPLRTVSATILHWYDS
jgi:hypothetical protein